MPQLSRRMFLTRGSLAVAAAGVATSVPLLVQAGDVTTQEAAATSTAELPEGASLAEPVLAHVRDLASGEISLFVGEREITIQDPQLVARLFRASR